MQTDRTAERKALSPMTSTAGAERAQPAEAPGKRKRDDEPPPDAEEEEEAVERKCGLDFDLLECPICSEPFSPPVYQVPTFHCRFRVRLVRMQTESRLCFVLVPIGCCSSLVDTVEPCCP